MQAGPGMAVTLSRDALTMFFASPNWPDVTGDPAEYIAVRRRAARNAAWVAQPAIRDIGGWTGLEKPTTLALTADSLELYALTSSRLLWWKRETTAAAWVFQELITYSEQGGFDFADSMALSPDGLELFIADERGERIAICRRLDRGAPWIAQPPLGNAPGSAIAVSEDGLELFAAAYDRIAAWRRASTASPWQPQAPLGGRSGDAINQFNEAEDVAISTDGSTLYVADPGNGRVAIWQRTAPGAAWRALGSLTDRHLVPRRILLARDGQELLVLDAEDLWFPNATFRRFVRR